ncbi:MAG: rhombotarget lipoprotein [Gammaproteobacteria bacterium]|nr:rhombotarget lipoprotein [Gammaproteobacteria bacterium]MDH5303925.1 rhombotarget lipoprotein [Gammaproteobacteria bacterium]MDH5321780.1 rhombotarget lipoprotein [Gammaproteobacteria bacterium]
MFKRMLLLVLIFPVLSACSSLWLAANSGNTRQGASSSLVDYLYPNGEIPPAVSDQLPSLSLPLRVGIAFVPSPYQGDIAAAEKQELLEQVANAFRDRPYVQSIDAIPDTYMQSARGLTGMQQVASLYGVDVMALVSYDQISFTDEKKSSLLYWTIIGAVAVKGSTNEVQTLIDTAVFDVATTRLLFRAPGSHRSEEDSTLIDLSKDLRKLRSAGFSAATADMIVNLDTELDGFREAVARGERAEVQWREGAGVGGVGSLALSLLALLVLVAFCREWRHRRLQPSRIRIDRRRQR